MEENIMSNNKNYFLMIEKQLVSVDKDLYLCFYKAKRQEKYLEEKDLSHGVVSYDAIDTNGINGEEMIPDTSESVEDIIEQKIMNEKLNQCVEKLTEYEQWLISELFFHGKSEHQLSKEIEIPRMTISNRKNKILKKLNILMKK
jgi:RNA polymerase sigma factor (sigma-70 family)